MLKSDERTNPQSCWNKAMSTERLFVLLARDAAAPFAIREWCTRRVEFGLNHPSDEQIREAMDCALAMEQERDGVRAKTKLNTDPLRSRSSKEQLANRIAEAVYARPYGGEVKKNYTYNLLIEMDAAGLIDLS
jgi:hypothetical protein